MSVTAAQISVSGRVIWRSPVSGLGDQGPGRREVEEVLAIDGGDLFGPDPVDQPSQRSRRSITGVVPTLEHGDQHRLPQLGVMAPTDRAHPMNATGLTIAWDAEPN